MRRKKRLVQLLLPLAAVSACQVASDPEPPLASGEYVFTHGFAEHPAIPGGELLVRIRDRRIAVINESETAVFPRGLIEEGTLMWHAKTRQWIIGTDPADGDAVEVGGCSDGPTVVDLQRKIYWTC